MLCFIYIRGENENTPTIIESLEARAYDASSVLTVIINL